MIMIVIQVTVEVQRTNEDEDLLVTVLWSSV